MNSIKKKPLRLASLVLTLVICLCFFTTVAQARASDYLLAYGASIVADGYGKVSVWYDVTGTGKMDEVGSTVITIYENGTLVKTFQYTTTPSMMAYNTNFHGGSVSYYGVSGRSYYSYVTFWAGKQGDGDNRTKQTSTIVAS